MISIYVVLFIIFEAILNRGTSESLSAGFKAGADKKELSVKGIFSSLPLIIFSYMYQPNVPALYQELEVPNLARGKLLICLATLLAATVYILAGTFGYEAFADGSTSE